jgi:flavin-dependent dehydrogenase
MGSSEQSDYDVAIIGGGPGGSTAGSLLKKYAPHLRIGIFEREKFPRDHIGESQLPPISAVLDEMGCFDAVEAANFPIKFGGTFRWGNSTDLWDFEFIPYESYVPLPRPRKYEGQVRQLAFQVDRAVYDKILLDHAKKMGCEVFEQCGVSTVLHDGDRVTGLRLEDGREITARHYVDASGNAGIMRKTFGIRIDAPTKLRNVAFWDYWDNAEWMFQFPGGATRILVLSIGSGWIWYIPIGETRTSIGYVCPAEYYKSSGKTPAEMYEWALSQEPLIAELTSKASREGKVRGTKDWSYLAERMVGENWYMVGECAGFADPILSAGLTLTQTGARELAFTILELDRGKLDGRWLKDVYAELQAKRIVQHIRFADLWYSANGIFTDLTAYTTAIAKDAGLELNPDEAFRWIAQGGFAYDNPGQVGIGGLDLAATKQVLQRFTEGEAVWNTSKINVYRMNLDGAEAQDMPLYHQGTVAKGRRYVRDGKVLPMVGLFAVIAECLRQPADVPRLMDILPKVLQDKVKNMAPDVAMHHALQCLEVMTTDGWVTGKFDPLKPKLRLSSPKEGTLMHSHREILRRPMNPTNRP